MLTIEIDSREFEAALKRYQDLTGKSWPDVLRQQARLVAVNLAHNTQPYGFSPSAREIGRGAVMRDIGKVYSTAGEIYADLRSRTGEKVARAFYGAIAQGKIPRAERILASVGLQIALGRFNPQLHKQRRDSRGRVRDKNPSQILSSPADSRRLQAYGRKIANRVGTAKSGWATVADNLGSMRGIPGWARRGKGPGRVVDNSRLMNNPHVQIENMVPWINRLLTGSAITQALKLQQEKMEKHIAFVMAANARIAGL